MAPPNLVEDDDFRDHVMRGPWIRTSPLAPSTFRKR